MRLLVFLPELPCPPGKLRQPRLQLQHDITVRVWLLFVCSTACTGVYFCTLSAVTVMHMSGLKLHPYRLGRKVIEVPKLQLTKMNVMQGGWLMLSFGLFNRFWMKIVPFFLILLLDSVTKSA